MIVAFLADSSPSSSAFEKYVGLLRSAGLIEFPESGALSLTEAGRSRANGGGEAVTHEAVMGKIERKLTPAQMRILHATAGSYPEPLTREELAEAAAMSPTSSTFEKYVGQLKTLGLITYPDRGIVRADDRLFP